MNWTEVIFDPLDTLTASDPRTMDLGGSAHLGALAPSAFAGLLRHRILEAAGLRFPPTEEEIDTNIPTALQIAAPLLRSKDGVTLVPLPRSVLRAPDAHATESYLNPLGSRVLADKQMENLHLLTGEREHEPDPRWTTLAGVCHLLGRSAAGLGDTWIEAMLHRADHVDLFDRIRVVERHWGHERAATGVPAPQTLWSRPVERYYAEVHNGKFRTGGYAALLRGAALSDSFVGRLGGDGHLVRVSCAPLGSEYAPVWRLRKLVEDSLEALRGLLLYLTTPALYDGWRPPAFAGLRLVAAAVGRPLSLGGWDLAKKRPKDMTRAVPAGSTYFFAVEQLDAAREFVTRFHWNDPLSRPGTGREGLGLSLCGVWDARTVEHGGS